MKKSYLTAIIVFILIPFLLIMLPQIVNDIACLSYQVEVEATLGEDEYIEIIEVVSACGNTSGTGDHTELWVGVIVKTSYLPDELKATYGAEVLLFSETDELHPWQNALFETDLSDSAEGYYILEFIEPAPLSWLDLRGV